MSSDVWRNRVVVDLRAKSHDPWHQAGNHLRITVDDRLMEQAVRSSKAPTMRAVVEEALRLLIQTGGQASVRRLRGKVEWDADLDISAQ